MKSLVTFLIAVASASAFAQPALNQEAYRALETKSAWVHPRLAGKLDVKAVEDEAGRLSPFQLRVLVVPELRGRWVSGATEHRGAFAKWLANEQLKLSRPIAIVVTRHGISAYCGEVEPNRLEALSNEAAKVGDPNNMTPAVLKLADSVRQAATSNAGAAVPAAGRASLPAPESGGGFPFAAGLGILAVGGLATWFVVKSAKLSRARRRAEGFKDRAVNGINYLDGYTDLLPAGPSLDAVKAARDKAEREYSNGLEVLKVAKTTNELDGASLAFGTAVQYVDEGRVAIEQATGGTNTAFAIDPGGLEGLDDPRIYQPVKNVCYFCSRPGKGDLTPVTVNIDGKRQTVLVCPDDMAEVKAGREPQVRGLQQGAQFTPWYNVQGYNPHTMFGSSNFVWDAILLSTFFHAMTPMYGYSNFMGGDAWNPSSYHPSSASDTSGGWGGDWGGFDSGSGGGDWGGGDFSGGGWDGGGGGGDSGGGDF